MNQEVASYVTALLVMAAILLAILVLVFLKARREQHVDRLELSLKDSVTAEAEPPEIWPFYPRKPLSQPEQVLYFRLLAALPEHIVLAQVQLSRILGVKKGNNHQSWLNRINRMSADFVVCSKDASVMAVIELDDSTHQRADRQVADDKKDKALTDAGIPIIRWAVSNMPDHDTILAAFEAIDGDNLQRNEE